MKNILENPEKIRGYLSGLDENTETYYSLFSNICSLLCVTRTALKWMENNPPEPWGIQPIDIVIMLDRIQAMLPQSEFELLDDIKDAVQ